MPAPKSGLAKPLPEQEKLRPGWKHVVRGDRVFKAQTMPIPTPTSSGTGRRTERQTTPADGRCKPACPEVSVDSHPPRSNRMTQNHHPTEEVSARGYRRSPGELFYQGLHRVDTPSSLHGLFPQTGESRPTAVLKTVIMFINEYGCAAKDKRGRSLAAGLLERWCLRQEAGRVPQ
jgi:hypothetical protein